MILASGNKWEESFTLYFASGFSLINWLSHFILVKYKLPPIQTFLFLLPKHASVKREYHERVSKSDHHPLSFLYSRNINHISLQSYRNKLIEESFLIIYPWYSLR